MSISDKSLKIEISKVCSIKNFAGYVKSLEYSDKIVLPLSVCQTLVR